MKKVLVTGGSGFIGKHFVRLIEKSYDVTNYDLKEGYDIRGQLPYGKFDYVVHFAALKSVPEGEKNPHAFIDTNCWGTVNILDRYKDARFLNISSSSVNDVRSVYGATKAFSEHIVMKHPNSLNIRLYNVFGEGQDFKLGGVIAKFICCRFNNIAPTLYGDGSQTRDFTYVGDVVESIFSLMTSKKVGVSHLGYKKSVSINTILNEIYGHNVVRLNQLPIREFEIKDSCSPEKMPVIKYGRKKGLLRTIKYYESIRH